MSMVRTLLCLAAAAMIINLANATTSFTVGGPTGGWDIATNLKAWSSSQTFSVGDNLIFQYTPNHNVLEVSKEDYDACQNSNPIQVYPNGATPITLTSPGSRYFICGVVGHCSLGMKVEIVTLAGSAPLPALSSPLPASPSPLPASSSPLPALLPVSSSPLPALSPPLPALSPETTNEPSDPSISPAAFAPPTETLTSQPPVSKGPTTLPRFPLNGAPQSFNPANALSTLPPPFSAAKVRATSSIGFAILVLVALFL